MRYQIGRCDYDILSSSTLVLLTGNKETAIFCKKIADKIKKQQFGDIWVCTSLVEFEERARFPAFLGRWWFSGSADRLSAEDNRAFQRLLKNPVEYGTAVLTGTDFNKYKEMARAVKQSTRLHEVSTSFPNKRFLVEYIRQGVIARGSKISQGAAETFIWRLDDAYSKYEYYLDRLVAELPDNASEVKAKHIQDTLKGVTGASFEDFIKYLMRPLSVHGGELKRTNKLFKSYRCMVDDGAAKMLRKLHAKAKQYLEIRRLINEGYIPVAVEVTVENLAKMLGEAPEETENKKLRKNREFTRWDILNWSDIKFRREVEIAASAPLADWYTIAVLSAKQCNTDEEAERVFYDIITRSRQTAKILDL